MMKKYLRIYIGILVIGIMFCAGCRKEELIAADTKAPSQAQELLSKQQKAAKEQKTAETELQKAQTQETNLQEAQVQEADAKEANAKEADAKEAESEEPQFEEVEVLGNPRSSYGLGSAKYLKGKNILLSLFVDTPESKWTSEEQMQTLDEVNKAVDYIKDRAAAYQIHTEILCDFTKYPELKKTAETDFVIREDADFVEQLDEEIALWQQEILCYDQMLSAYEADGIAAMIFVNNPGVSYAIVYDGTDSEKETMILFAKDYFNPQKQESATVYAHEILHVFGAHDLYEDAEFTKEVSDYVALTYPQEIMYTVTQATAEIDRTISPVTAYHLGWLDDAEEVILFPQLKRQ